jgi:hypothetical protein
VELVSGERDGAPTRFPGGALRRAMLLRP